MRLDITKHFDMISGRLETADIEHESDHVAAAKVLGALGKLEHFRMSASCGVKSAFRTPVGLMSGSWIPRGHMLIHSLKI